MPESSIFGVWKTLKINIGIFTKTRSLSPARKKNSETGHYHFGARYYDPSLSGLFLSVDPMSDKYPSISPYAYCAWNPVKLVDTDGKEWDKPEDKEKAQKNGTAIDLRYVTADGKGCSNYLILTPDQIALNNKFIQCLHDVGFTRSISGGRLNTTR